MQDNAGFLHKVGPTCEARANFHGIGTVRCSSPLSHNGPHMSLDGYCWEECVNLPKNAAANPPAKPILSFYCCLCNEFLMANSPNAYSFGGARMHMACVDKLFLSLPPRKEPFDGKWIDWNILQPPDYWCGLTQLADGSTNYMRDKQDAAHYQCVRWFNPPAPPPWSQPDSDVVAFNGWRDHYLATEHQGIGPEGVAAWYAALEYARKEKK